MDIATFSQLGIGLATLFILWIVVKFFIDALNKKEDANNANVVMFNKTIAKFNKTINNHIEHQTAVAHEQKQSIEALTLAIKEMTVLIKKPSS